MKVGYLIGGGLLGLICRTAALADLPTADEIIKKCLASYDKAKTFQCVVSTNMVHGGYSMKAKTILMVVNNGKGAIARSFMNASSSIGKLEGGNPMRQLTIDDGKNIYVVLPDTKKYHARPHVIESISGQLWKSFDVSSNTLSKSLVTIVTEQNRTVYKLTSTVRGTTSVIRIDLTTYLLKSIKGYKGNNFEETTFELDLTNQIFDQPISESVFNWVSPVTYRRVDLNKFDKP